MRRKISAIQARPLITAYVGGKGEALSKQEKLTLVRYCLEEFAERHPGKSVEIRIPYAGAVQAIAGLSHRRGTPPNVVEMGSDVWLALCAGEESWEELHRQGKISASGTRADLSEYFPLL